MSKSPLAASAALFLLAGCGQASDHGHGHDHDGTEAHHEPAAGTDHQEDATVAAASATPQPFPLGAWTATLEVTGDQLRMSAVDASGAAVAPDGDVRVVLTGTGQDEQRVVLTPDGAGWAGAASASGAPGYTAVVQAQVGEHTESSKVSWGQVPSGEHAEPHGDDAHEGDAHDHGGHDHGSHGH